jgi:ABC-type transport system involved in cytochrome c biogenesis permease subunit
MEEVSRIQTEVILPRDKAPDSDAASWTSYLPAILAIAGSFVMLFARIEIGGRFMSDGALMMVALACYLLAALFQLTNLYAPSDMAQKIGLWTATLGVFFNLSSWLVRWVGAYDREIAMMRAGGNMETPWFFRYVPFANLYDMSLAFAFGAGIATLLFAHRKNFQVLAAFTLPLAALILTLARFIGSEFIDLPPVLDSYWRPIHVGVAALSYGIALVCFAVAVIYLLKDRMKVEVMAIWTSVFALGVIATVSKFSVFTEFVYRAGTFVPNPQGGKPFSGFFRLDIPYVGPTLAVAGVLLIGVIVSYLLYVYQSNQTGKKIGDILLKLAFVTQILAIVFLVSGIKSSADIYPQLQSQLAKDPSQFVVVGKEIASKQQLSAQEFAALPNTQLEQTARQYLQNNGNKMFLGFNTNPVELAGLITALAGTFFRYFVRFSALKNCAKDCRL